MSRSYEAAIVARAGTYYRTTRYIMVLVLIACGGWFAYDGWYGYPKTNARIKQLDLELRQLDAQRPRDDAGIHQREDERAKYKPQSDLDISIQKYLSVGLPIAGLLMLLWTLYHSRGVYRFSNQMLEIPGHPSLALEQITHLDQTLWERKGIAFIEYKTPAAEGRIRLDDFIYERDPTDAIFKKIQDHFAGREEP
jgi:hypothetical protein